MREVTSGSAVVNRAGINDETLAEAVPRRRAWRLNTLLGFEGLDIGRSYNNQNKLVTLAAKGDAQRRSR